MKNLESNNNNNRPDGQKETGTMETNNNNNSAQSAQEEQMKKRLKARIYRALKNEVGIKMSARKAEHFRSQILEGADEVLETNFGLDVYNDYSSALVKLGRNYYQVFVRFDSVYRQTTFSFNKLDAESVEEGQE